MRKLKVLILVDNGIRDLLSCRILQERFVEKGVKTYLCNKRNMLLVLRQIQPDAFIVPRGDLPYLSDIAKCCNLYIAPCEGGRLTLKTMMSVFLGRVHGGGDVLSKNGARVDQAARKIIDFGFIRRVYLWGVQTYQFLADSNYFKKSQLMLAGSVKLDVYRQLNNAKQPRRDFTLGIAFSSKATSVFDGKLEYAKWLYHFDEKSHLPMVPPGRHWEDYAWRDFAILRRMMRLIKIFLRTFDGTVYLRVAPLEDPKQYQFLEKLHPGRVIIQKDKGELYEFLASIDMLLTCWSTTGLEALLMGVPVVAIPYIMDYNHLVSHVDLEANGFTTYLPCYYLPRSEDEVIELIRKGREGTLPVSPNQEQLNQLLKNIYNWPSVRSASEVIIDDILSDLVQTERKRKKIWDLCMPPIPGLLGLVIKGTPTALRFFEFWLLEKISFMRHAFFDLCSGGYRGAMRHHTVKNPHVERVLRRSKLLSR